MRRVSSFDGLSIGADGETHDEAADCLCPYERSNALAVVGVECDEAFASECAPYRRESQQSEDGAVPQQTMVRGRVLARLDLFACFLCGRVSLGPGVGSRSKG